MKFEEIKVNEVYEVDGVDHQVIHKHDESKTVFTFEVVSKNPYGWTRHDLQFFSPIALPKTGLLVSGSGAIVYRTGKKTGFGFSLGNNWYCNDNWGGFAPENWRKATLKDEEKFKKSLIKEAAKRGLVDGVEFESASSGDKSIINTKVLSIGSYGFTIGTHYVFYKGKWATPIKNEKQDELDRTIEKLFKLGEELGIEVTIKIEEK